MPNKSLKPGAVKKRRPTSKLHLVTSPASQDAIAMRAYELFLQRGAEHGRDLEHWLQAERELMQA